MAHPRIWVKSHLWCIAPLGGVAEARQNIQLRLAGRAFFKLSGTHQSAQIFFQGRPRPVVPPSPTCPPFLSVFLSACLPWSSSCSSSAAGPARRGQIQSDRAMLLFPWLVEWSLPWLSSRPGLAAECESEAPCWWTWSITISLSSTTQER